MTPTRPTNTLDFIRAYFTIGYCTTLLVASLIASTTNVVAQETPDLSKPQILVPEKIAGVTTLTADQLIKMLTSDQSPLLVDARIKKDRIYGYIESSISLPDIKTNCDSLKTIIKDKNQDVVFYCNGVQCGRSVVSIKIARSCGYHNLSWFKGGYAEWIEKGYQYVKNK